MVYRNRKITAKRRTLLRKYAKNFNKRKPYRKYKSNSNMPRALKVLPSPSNFLASRIKTRLTYAEDITFYSNPAVVGLQYRLNSLFDPYLTGVGHQPYLFDQWSTFYNQYIVTGCKATVKLIVDGDDTLQAWATINGHTNDSTWGSPSSIQQAIEMKSPYRMLDNDKYNTLSRYFSVASIYGKSKSAVLTDDAFAAYVTTNPVNQAILDIQVQTLDGTNTTVRGVLTLQFDCEFYSPKLISSS